MTAFRLEKSRSSIVLYFLISLPLIFLLLSFKVCNLHAAPFSVRFLGLLLLVPSASYVMASCSIHLEQVLIPGKLLILRLSSVYCRLGKPSWVFSASCSCRFSFNPSAIDILFTSLTKFQLCMLLVLLPYRVSEWTQLTWQIIWSLTIGNRYKDYKKMHK